MQKCPGNQTMNQRKFKFWEKVSGFYAGDMTTYTGDGGIGVVSERVHVNGPRDIANWESA